MFHLQDSAGCEAPISRTTRWGNPSDSGYISDEAI
jgi:hypothetical protein